MATWSQELSEINWGAVVLVLILNSKILITTSAFQTNRHNIVTDNAEKQNFFVLVEHKREYAMSHFFFGLNGVFNFFSNS